MSSIPPTTPFSQVAGDDSLPTNDQIVLTTHQSAPVSPPPSTVGQRPLHPPTIEALVSGRAWEAVTVDDKVRFLVGVAQMFGTGAGYIITQPTERDHWQALVALNYITCDEDDPYVLHLTDGGSILFYTVLNQYIPVEERR